MIHKLNICAVVGTMHKESNTGYFLRRFIEMLKEQTAYEVEYEIFNLFEYRIHNCIGCYSCATKSNCLLNDDMEFLKMKMLESNIIIWATPVYMNNISGIMKTFIDRLHMWTKTLHLSGKHSIMLSTSSHAGGDIYVLDYLTNIISSLGAVNIGKYNLCLDFPKELYVRDKEEILLQDFIKQTLDNLLKNYYLATPLQEMIFKDLKTQIISLNPKDIINNYIPQYWKDKGMKDSDNFQQYLNLYK